MATRRQAASFQTGDLFGPGGPRLPSGDLPGKTGENAHSNVHSNTPSTARSASGEIRSDADEARRIILPEPSPAPPLRALDEPFREFTWSGGVHLTDSVLWCDTDRRHDLAFISHAHFDGMGKNRRILATSQTVKILTRASGKVDTLTSPYRHSFTLGQLELELYPAGHVLGSAQLLVQRDGRRIVYTSDVNTRRSSVVDMGVPIPCDVLAIPATYGLPIYRFPPAEEVLASVKKFVDDCLDDKATPVLIANQIGTAQELMYFLGKAGHRLRAHRSIHDITKIYREFDVEIEGARSFQGNPARDEVVIFPPILRKHTSIRKLRKYKTAIVTGHAVEEGFAQRHRVDVAFALSDTVDYEGLLKFIRATGAKEVYLTGGHISQFAEDLRRENLRAYSLIAPEQLALF